MKDNKLLEWLKDNRKRLLISYPLIFIAAIFIFPPLAAVLLLPILLVMMAYMALILWMWLLCFKNIFSGRDKYSSIDGLDKYGPDDGDAGE